MNDVEKLIEGSERLIGIFGYWPSFHDAEIIEFNLWRGDIDPAANRYILPVLTTRVHLWELTSEVDVRGYLVRRHHTLAGLRFHDVDNFHMEDFNSQNAIFHLALTPADRGPGFAPGLRVEFEPANGINANFRCSRLEVFHTEPSPSPPEA